MTFIRRIFAITLLFIATACGGGGGSNGGTQPPALAMSLSNKVISVSGTSQHLPATPNITLTITGNMPSAGLYYGWKATTNGIDHISAYPSGNTIDFIFFFKAPGSLALGTYQDEVTVFVTTGQGGENQISNSPQTIATTYNVFLPPPQITDISPASTYVGGPTFNLTLAGSGFRPEERVLWNGTPMPTSYVSSTTITATIPAQAITTVGTAQVSVVGPDVETSSSIPFLIANSQATFISLPVFDIAWDGDRQVIYASIMSDATSNPNTIAAIDPVGGQVIKTVSTGVSTYPQLTGPTFLAISDDYSFLYAFVYLNQSGIMRGVIQRYNLPSLALDPSFSIPFGTDPTYGGYYATAIQVARGAPHTLAVSRGLGSGAGGVVIFDDTVQRGPALLDSPQSNHIFTSLQWGANSSTLYAAGTLAPNLPGEYLAMNIDSSGLSIHIDLPNQLAAGAHDIHFVDSTGKIYVGNGQVLEASSGQIAGTCGGGWAGMVPDPVLGIGFYIDRNTVLSNGSYGIQLHSYNLANYAAISSTTVPLLIIPNSSTFYPSRMIHCGPSMLALVGVPVEQGGSGNICLITGPFVQGK